jgi:hypothetical protein
MLIQEMEQLDICDVLRTISDDKALAIFNTIALSDAPQLQLVD